MMKWHYGGKQGDGCSGSCGVSHYSGSVCEEFLFSDKYCMPLGAQMCLDYSCSVLGTLNPKPCGLPETSIIQ